MMPESGPEAPAAITSRSRRTTRAPASARNAAVAEPTMPPPMTTPSGGAATLHRCRGGGGRGRAGPTVSDGRDRVEQAIDLGGSVVVGQADAKDAALRGETEPLDQPGRVEVAIPRRDPLAPERLCRCSRRDTVDRQR